MNATRIPGFEFPGGQPKVQTGPTDKVAMSAVEHPLAFALASVAFGLVLSVFAVAVWTVFMYLALNVVGNFDFATEPLIGFAMVATALRAQS